MNLQWVIIFFFCSTTVKDHESQITTADIIMREEFEILWELSKYDTETWNEQMPLEKQCLYTCSM